MTFRGNCRLIWTQLFFAFTIVFSLNASAGVIVFVDAPNSRKISVELASNPDQWAKGLMGRSRLLQDHGMWFVFPADDYMSFWMKNMLIPIDIIFVDKDFVIRKITHSAPPCLKDPCVSYSSGQKVRYVLEVTAGFCELNGVKVNQRLQFVQSEG